VRELAEAISAGGSRREGIPSFAIHDAEAISGGGFPVHHVKRDLQSLEIATLRSQ